MVPRLRKSIGPRVAISCAISISCANLFAAIPGARDTSFVTPSATDTYPTVVTVGPSAVVVVGGLFQNYAGQGRKSVARLAYNGLLDTTFNAGAGALFNGQPAPITELKVGPDGKTVVVGSFDKFNTTARLAIARLNVNGSVDLSFNPSVVGVIKAVAVQNDGKVLLVGPDFVNGATSPWKIFRLNVDGSIDDSFIGPALGTGGDPVQVKVLASGKIAIAATHPGEILDAVSQVIRLNADGSVDTSFALGSGATDGSLTRIEEVEDGKILVAGTFSAYNDVPALRLARLTTNGAVDPTFHAGGIEITEIKDIAVQQDHRVFVVGSFNGSEATLVRLDSYGAFDPVFVPAIGNSSASPAYAVVMQYLQPLVAGHLASPPISGVFRFQQDIIARPVVPTPPAQTVTAGGTAMFKVAATGAGPLSYQWMKQGVAIDGATTDTLTINNVTMSDDANYNVVVSNSAGDSPSYETHLQVLPAAPGAQFVDSLPVPTVDGEVKRIIRAPDGKLIVSGVFSNFTGVPSSQLVRLFSNGQVDSSFVASMPGNSTMTSPYALGIQQNGTLLVAGNIAAEYGGIQHTGLLRFLATGALDTTFNLAGTGSDHPLLAVSVQSDDKIIAGGSANSYNGVALGHLFRLDANGGVDMNFNNGGIGTQIDSSSVNDFAIRSDGKIFAIGSIPVYNGVNQKGIILLNQDGTLDSSFMPQFPSPFALNAIAVQPDGKLIVGGAFLIQDLPSPFPGVPGGLAAGVVRLNVDGALDETFNSPYFGAAAGEVRDVALQKDGKILMGGGFVLATGQRFLVRLNTDGSLDSNFRADSSVLNPVNTICVTDEDTLWVGGGWITSDSAARFITRLNIGPYDYKNQIKVTPAGATMAVDWPIGYLLQETPTLDPPAWTTLPDAPPLTVDTSTGNRFFRLILKP
jgi:uncharacterized delta-60 repeat protein